MLAVVGRKRKSGLRGCLGDRGELLPGRDVPAFVPNENCRGPAGREFLDRSKRHIQRSRRSCGTCCNDRLAHELEAEDVFRSQAAAARVPRRSLGS
jgi:hypothetical protein